jgi:L-lactate dehydrogenase complex protein LldE
MHKVKFEQRPRRVALFVTCMVDMLYPGVGIAACELLEKNEVEVIFPEEQTCCGQPAFNAGYRDEARKLARRFLSIFGPLVESGEVDAVVAPSGSCATMTSHFFELIFQESQETDLAHQAGRLASVTFELSEFLVDVLGLVNTGAQLQGKATYHPCCHLYRELGVDEQPRKLLDGVEGLEVVDLPHGDDCCGFGGLFAIKNSGISAAMGRAKARCAEQSGADAIVLCDVSCMTHINGILSREGVTCRAHHIAEVLNNHLGGSLRPPSQPQPAQPDHPRRWGE